MPIEHDPVTGKTRLVTDDGEINLDHRQPDVDDAERERIGKLIGDGYREGEVMYDDGSRGWWKIIFN